MRSKDGRRVALREFLVFDKVLRTKLMETDPSEWPALTRKAVDAEGQSYRTAIDRALALGRITEETAAHELREIG